jgi:hypothetical protein
MVLFHGVSFTDGSFYFPYLPSDILMYEFLIKVIDLGDNPTPPFDARFEVTIVEIMKLFFANNLNSLIYICETLDNRQHSRFRKFDLWFKKTLRLYLYWKNMMLHSLMKIPIFYLP